MNQRVTASRTARVTASAPNRVAASDQAALARPSSDLGRAVNSWLADGKAQGWSRATLADRRKALERFCWWLEHEEEAPLRLAAITPARVRAFLSYAREARPEGRYGSSRPSACREARPATVNAYFRILRAFFNFCQAEGLVDAEQAPLKNVRAPRVPVDQIQPLSHDQVQALIDAARRSRCPERNVAIILVLVDTGMRCSELTNLSVGDVDRGTGELVVTGKGNKRRRVFMGLTARRALWRYLEQARQGAFPDEPLLVSEGGLKSGTVMTHTGVHEVIANAGRAGRVTGVRCSPHTLRHTFAINFLRSGGNLLELQQLLGHEDLTVLRRYVALAEADLAQAHRNHSPADRMKLK